MVSAGSRCIPFCFSDQISPHPSINSYRPPATKMRYVRNSHTLNDDIPLNSPLYEALPSTVIRAIRSDLQQEISNLVDASSGIQIEAPF